LFDQKLAEATGHVGKIEEILKALAAGLDAARLRQAVPAEADVERIEALFGQYHHALSRARDAWLRNDLGAAAYARLAAVATPADLGLTLHVDVRQSRAAQEQEEQIGRRLGGRTQALARILAAIRLLEAPPPGVELLIGGGVVVTLVKTTGPWCIVKYVPSEKGFPYAKPISAGTAETLGGLTLATTIVRWWLLLGAERPTAARPAPSPSADDAVAETAGEFDGASDVQYNNEHGEQASATKAGTNEDPDGLARDSSNLHGYAGHGPTNATAPSGLSKLGIQLRNLYLKRAGLGALIVPQVFTGFVEWLLGYHWSFQDDGSIENADNSPQARHAFMIQNALNSGVATDGEWHKVYAENVDIYKTISKKQYDISIKEQKGVPALNQASFWLGGSLEFRAKGSYETSMSKKDGAIVAEFRNMQMVWGWVDEVDARSAIEYSWLVDSFGQGLVETTIGDILGDKILNGNYKAVIGFWETGRAGVFKYDLSNNEISTLPAP
jgi:hypothetical protein